SRVLDLYSVRGVFHQLGIGRPNVIHRGIRVFFKQVGSQQGSRHKMKADPKGGDFDDYPAALDWLKIREVPESPLTIFANRQLAAKTMEVIQREAAKGYQVSLFPHDIEDDVDPGEVRAALREHYKLT